MSGSGPIDAGAFNAVVEERDRLRAIIDTPETDNFVRGVAIKAEHQRALWNDKTKGPADWFWLVGYLAGKALHASIAGDRQKAMHHTITAAAALANWHRALRP